MESLSVNILSWIGIVFCISQSAMFSGLNLALLGVSRLRLEVEASSGNTGAQRILKLRRDFNFLLTTILWGNVAINVLLTLISNSVMAGVSAFLFSTVLITFFGEIAPQAYFSRHAIRMGSLLAPVLRVYQWILYPVARPSALVLDWWLGKEGIAYYREADLHTVIRKHIEADESDVSHIEGTGAMNFLALDDILVQNEGEVIDPQSIVSLTVENNRPQFPEYKVSVDDPFLVSINRSAKKWIVITNTKNQPEFVLNANTFLRDVFFSQSFVDPCDYCHRPIVVSDEATLLGKVISAFRVDADSSSDDVVDQDLILYWSDTKRIITGSDLLGRLLRGIVIRHQLSVETA